MENEKVSISLITGFLGSGKTTVINHLLTTPAMARTVVLVNEFGQISIDGDLIRRSDDTVVELKNGCVCCSLNDDLGTTLHKFIAQRRSGELPAFEKVLIETTGLANAGPVVQVILLDPLVRDDYRLDKVITTVDTVHGVTNLNVHAETVEQVAVADRLILTKLDRQETEKERAQVEELRARLARLNPSAPVLEADRGQVNADILFAEDPGEELLRYTNPSIWVSDHHDHDHGDDHRHAHARPPAPPQGDGGSTVGFQTHRHDHHIKSFCIVRDEPVALDALQRFWAELANEAGLNLLRVKGLVNVSERPDRPAVVQGVQQSFDDVEWLPAWPSDDRTTRLVFIGWMLDENHVRRLLGETRS